MAASSITVTLADFPAVSSLIRQLTDINTRLASALEAVLDSPSSYQANVEAEAALVARTDLLAKLETVEP